MLYWEFSALKFVRFENIPLIWLFLIWYINMTFLTGNGLGEASAWKTREFLGRRTKWTSRKCILRKEIILKNHFATVHENISTSWVFLKAWNKADKRKYEPLKYEKSLQVHVRVIWDEGREGVQLFVCIRQTCSFCRATAGKTLQIDPHFSL